ncbi:MAG: chemotaxis protein CheD [Promethearchaeota archaeon]
MMEKINSNGRIEITGKDGEIALPIGHYVIVHSTNKVRNFDPKISIIGLGSCIALILFDSLKRVGGMSHVLLSNSKLHKNIEFPHKYADLSVKLLVQELIKHGAIKKNIKAIIIGGSKIFDIEGNTIGTENINAIKKKLKELQIKIIGENTGGSEGRVVKFNTKEFSVYVSSTKESKFKKLRE